MNTPPAAPSPRQLADRIALVAGDAGLAVDIWDEARIRQERFGGLLGVAAGSNEPPRFVVLDYRHGGETPTLALVGKGVTFDSGGLSLKPSRVDGRHEKRHDRRCRRGDRSHASVPKPPALKSIFYLPIL